MEIAKYKTNLKCSGCVEKVKPYLDELLQETDWQVDLQDQNKTLTVKQPVDEVKVKSAFAKAGYKAEKL
jgi:copper chaperone CopZ